MYLSRQLSRKQEVIKDLKKGFLPLIIPIVIICLLIAPANLSTALLTGATGCCLCLSEGQVLNTSRPPLA
jgi:cell division protein FtsW